MKTKFIVVIVVITAIVASWCTTTDEATANNVVYDAAYDQYVAEYGETAGWHLFQQDQK